MARQENGMQSLLADVRTKGGVIDGTTHMSFGGVGLGAEHVKPIVTGTIASFLEGVRDGQYALPAVRSGMTLEEK